MGGGLVEQELAFGEAAGAQETIERGGRQAGLMRFAGGGQFAQQSGAGAMRVLAFEPFDEGGGVRRDGAGLPAVLTRFGRQGGESVAAVAQRPIQQRVHRDLAAGGMRNVVEAGGDLLRAAREFAAGQRLQHQGRDETVTEERDLFGFVVHRVVFSPGRPAYGGRLRGSMQMVCGEAQAGARGGEECGTAAVGSQTARPAQQVAAHAGKQEAMSGDPSGGLEHGESAMDEVGCGSRLSQCGQCGAQRLGLRAEAANPELAALVGHGRRRGAGGGLDGLPAQQTGHQEQRNHHQARPQVGQDELGQQGDGALGRRGTSSGARE